MVKLEKLQIFGVPKLYSWIALSIFIYMNLFSLAFYVFFIAHGLLLIVALAIPVLTGWRARGYDDVKALLLMDAYVLLIIPVNLWLDTNYGYTQGIPVEGTLLDYLGEAPWYYLWAQLPVLAVFRLLMLPVHDKSED